MKRKVVFTWRYKVEFEKSTTLNYLKQKKITAGLDIFLKKLE